MINLVGGGTLIFEEKKMKALLPGDGTCLQTSIRDLYLPKYSSRCRTAAGMENVAQGVGLKNTVDW